MDEVKGSLNANQLRFGIVIARFNETITKSLLEGAIDALKRHGAVDENITVVWVPGSFEVPIVAKKMAQQADFDAIICLGAIIRGATAHFDYVAGQTANGISQIALETEKPVIFGVLTTDTIEQAMERSGIKNGNKGFEAAQSAIEMGNLMNQLKEKVF